MNPHVLAKKVGYNECLRYLNGLILANDRDRSDLYEVGEKSDEKKSWSRSGNAQNGNS